MAGPRNCFKKSLNVRRLRGVNGGTFLGFPADTKLDKWRSAPAVRFEW